MKAFLQAFRVFLQMLALSKSSRDYVAHVCDRHYTHRKQG
jgi:hypothetical protein